VPKPARVVVNAIEPGIRRPEHEYRAAWLGVMPGLKLGAYAGENLHEISFIKVTDASFSLQPG
jgi:hypothetical protein